MTWRTVPWCMNPGGKSHMHSLLDILSHLPGLKEEFDYESDYFILEEEASRVYSNLLCWRHEWDLTPEGVSLRLRADLSRI